MKVRALALAAAAACVAASPAAAQPLGTFAWQLQPFCNRVVVSVVQNGAAYMLDGYDDQCSAAQRLPVVGSATFNPDGSVEMGFSSVPSSGVPLQFRARIDLGSLSGTWTDSQGNTGTFAFGASTGGSARPVPSNVVPPGRVGAAQINTAEVQRRVVGSCAAPLTVGAVNADGTVQCQSGAGGGDITGVAAGSGLTGGGGNGDVTLGVAFAGSGSADTAARSDHNHINTTTASVAIGVNTMLAGTGAQNVAIGHTALRNNTSGSQNVAVGTNAVLANTTGSQNTGLGHHTFVSLTTGNNNIAIGFQAGGTVSTGSNNIYLGADATSAAESNTMRLGTLNVTQTAVMHGVSGRTSSAGVAVFVNNSGVLGTLTSSQRFKDDVVTLGADTSTKLQALRPVQFVYKPGVDDGSKTLQYGLIAEEVEKAFPELVVRNDDGTVQTVRYHFLTPLLLAEVQRLERERAALASESAGYRAELEAQARRLDELQQQLSTLVAADAKRR